MSIEIYFVGMSKNCFNTLKKNIEYLLEFRKNTDTKFEVCVIDSDSVDGTKAYCNELKKNNLLNDFIEIDNLETLYKSRIERLSICRNEALNYLKNKISENEAIFIPMDLDLDLFEFLDYKNLEYLIGQVKNNIDGIFPYSIPYYYDIFALRSENWVTTNNVYIAEKKKQKYKIFSFIFNYLYIFRFQKKKGYFKESLISVTSAFGGMGIYKIQKDLLNVLSYKTAMPIKDSVSEHVYFNSYFKNLYINQDWIVRSPSNYIIYNSSNFFNKIIYFLKTLKHDFISLK